MRTKPVVGQVVYRLETRYNEENRAENILRSYPVKAVGRKYFTVVTPGATWDKTRVAIADWLSGERYSGVYESEKDYQDSLQRDKLREDLRRIFGGYERLPFSLDQLTRIMAITKEVQPELKTGQVTCKQCLKKAEES